MTISSLSSSLIVVEVEVEAIIRTGEDDLRVLITLAVTDPIVLRFIQFVLEKENKSLKFATFSI